MTLILALAAYALAQATAPVAPFHAQETHDFNFYPGGKIAITSEVPGGVKVIGWKKSAVKVETEKIVYLPAGEAQAVAAQYPISVRHTQTTVTVRFTGPVSPSVEINAVVYVPAVKTDLALRLPKGDASVEGVNGWIEVNLQEGNLDAAAVRGYFSGVTRRGDLRIELAGVRWEGHSFTAATLEGSVTLRVPRVYSAALQLLTRNGNITVDYPEQVTDGEKVPLTVASNKNARSLKATLGEGGAAIRVSTSLGDCSLAAIEPGTTR
jgi:DUF4097 and DUF4098 domain-containing protein YvlB